MSFIVPLQGVAGARAHPKVEAFKPHDRPGVFVCPLCRRWGNMGWVRTHARREHVLCTCANWYVSIGAHLSSRHRHGIAHRAILSSTGGSVEGTEQ